MSGYDDRYDDAPWIKGKMMANAAYIPEDPLCSECGARASEHTVRGGVTFHPRSQAASEPDKPFTPERQALVRYVAKAIRTENRETATVWVAREPLGMQWSPTFDNAFPFETPEQAKLAGLTCPGPWYFRPDVLTLEIIKVYYTPPTAAEMVLAP